MITKLRVAQPWAWSWCPPDALPITQSPDLEDGRNRNYGHRAPDWDEVAHAVVAAVNGAQRELTAELVKWAKVEVPGALSAPAARVAQSWLSLAEGVIWSLADQPTIGNGRHRLWACRDVYGIGELPLRVETLTALPDALIDFGNETDRRGMATAVLADLEGVEATLASRVDLAVVNRALIANVAAAVPMLRRGVALMTSEQWTAASA